MRYSVYRNNTTGRLRAVKCRMLNPLHTDDETMVSELDATSRTEATVRVRARMDRDKEARHALDA